MVGLLLAAAVAAGGPSPDIGSAARRLAPTGATVVLAEERSWDRGVVAWRRDDEATAVPLVWRDRRWRATAGSGITITVSRPRVVGRRVRQTVQWAMRRPLVDDAVWVDGRPLEAWFFPGPVQGATAVISTRLRPGRHVFVAYAATFGGAAARAWTVTVR
jgi:hypothetical protein